ncbi:MAG: response regulator [Caulobacteraceae bacterium]|nr:response regulator [Caulobacteraceae bacterium]
MQDPPPADDVHLLIVDDDAELRSEISAYLTNHGYVLHEARDSEDMWSKLSSAPIQLVILDVVLPGEDGLTICRRLLETGGPPVLMLSAMGESVDRILGLELGADDYLVKPVNPRELLARVRAMLRRRSGEPRSGRVKGYAFAGFRLDLTRRQLKAPNGVVLMLTPGELSLLGAFVEHPQKVLAREELMEIARGAPVESLDRAVDIQISRLRRKIHAQCDQEIIKTRRGSGYILDTPVTTI